MRLVKRFWTLWGRIKDIRFWAYYADYDWVVLCQLFGTMMDLPDGWPMYCRDLKQEADRLQDWWRFFNNTPDYKLRLPEQGKGEHHALADAKWNREAWKYLESLNYKTGVYRMRPT